MEEIFLWLIIPINLTHLMSLEAFTWIFLVLFYLAFSGIFLLFDRLLLDSATLPREFLINFGH